MPQSEGDGKFERKLWNVGKGGKFWVEVTLHVLEDKQFRVALTSPENNVGTLTNLYQKYVTENDLNKHCYAFDHELWSHECVRPGTLTLQSTFFFLTMSLLYCTSHFDHETDVFSI